MWGYPKIEKKKYLTFVSKALEILKINIPNKKKDLDTILQVLKEFANGPVTSQSDISVHDQVRELVKAIELEKTPEEITNILERLEDETHYRDDWD